MEAFTGLRSQGGVPVTQGVGLKKTKMPRHPVSPKGVLLIVLLDLLKVSQMTNFNYELFKVSKMTNFNYHHKNHPTGSFFMVKNCYKFSKVGIQGNDLYFLAWDFRVVS